MMNLTARETKNKILADMPASESLDALVGTTRDGFIILTERRVFEIYTIRDAIDVSVKKTVGDWEDYE